MNRPSPHLHRHLDRARSLAVASPGGPFNLAAMAQEAGLSAWHFHRLFTQCYHETPHQFLNRLRLQRARDLLILSDISVAEVCLEVGFRSVGTFTTAFTRQHGVSPTEFRRSARRSWAIGRLWSPRFIPHCMVQRWNPQDLRSVPAAGPVTLGLP